jgi:DNA-binding NtrC family response regulator
VGSTKRVSINVRILAATNCDLEQAVAHGAFRRDLYFRLNVLSLRIPSLRERRQDIPTLALAFHGALVTRRRPGADAQRRCTESPSRINVRELENCLERACAFTTGPVIQVGDLPSAIHSAPGNYA